jgi:hypothetical protein
MVVGVVNRVGLGVVGGRDEGRELGRGCREYGMVARSWWS